MKTFKDLAEAGKGLDNKQAQALIKDLKVAGFGGGEIDDDSSSDLIRVSYNKNRVPPVIKPKDMLKILKAMQKHSADMLTGSDGSITFAIQK